MIAKGVESDFDVVAEWGSVCDWFEDEDMLREVNKWGMSPEDADEMRKLDPKTTWEKIAPGIRSSCITDIEFKYTNPKDTHTNHHMDLKQQQMLPRQTWLLHFTNEAEDIARNGFKIGFNDEKKLGLTAQFYGNSRHKQGMGYNFAFLPRDADLEQVNVTYGKNAVLFQSSGVYVRHHNDRENQVIFAGGEVDPSNIVMLRRDGKKEWSVVAKQKLGKTDRDVILTRPLKECISWVQANFSKYKRLFQVSPEAYNKQTQRITAGKENPPEPEHQPGQYQDMYKDMFAEEITRKPEIGRGSYTSVYPITTRPDMVAKKMFAGDLEGTMHHYQILQAHPDLFSKVHKIYPEKGIMVVEKLDVRKSVALGHEMEAYTYDYPQCTESIRNVMNRIAQNRPLTPELQYTLSLMEQGFPEIVERVRYLCENIRKLFPGHPIDFQFENMGFDKHGTLKFLDI